MAQNDHFGTGKSLVVLAIVLGCFAILWPKIFYPMMQTAFAITSPKVDADGRFQESDQRIPPHLHPAASNPRTRNQPPEDINDKFLMRDGRPFPHPQSRQPVKSTPKSGGAMSIIMPIYTVGIVVFFLYTVLKLVFKKPPEGDKKPLIKDFHLDPEYRKYVCQQPPIKLTAFPAETKKPAKKQTIIIPETPTSGGDEGLKDYEIYKLRKKLEDTEVAMERIMKHMGVMNACLGQKAKLEKKLANTQNCDLRQRHKCKPKDDSTQPQDERLENNNDGSSLEDDLAELINMCNETGKTIKKYSDEDYKKQVSQESDPELEEEEEEDLEDEVGSSDEEQEEVAMPTERCGVKGCCDKIACS